MAQQIRIPIHTLAGGVGRQPVTKRLPSEAEELDNVFLTIEKSIEKRNGFDYFSGKDGVYLEDVDLAPESIVFNTLDLTIGGGTGTSEYIPEDEDEFFFEWLELDSDNVFLMAVNLSLAPKQPVISNLKEVKGSTQDYVWSDYTESYDTTVKSENFKKKFITVWKLENTYLSLQTVDYDSLSDGIIDYLQYGYVANNAQSLVKAKAFGTSVMLLNTLVPAGYKKLYKTDISGSPIVSRTIQNSDIKIKVKASSSGSFNGYEQHTSSNADLKTFSEYSSSPFYNYRPQEGDIVYIFDSTNTTLIGYFTLLNTKSKFQLISFDEDDIGEESSLIPKNTTDTTKYTFRIGKTVKDKGSEEIRYRTAAFPKSLGYQSIPITMDTLLKDLNGINMTTRATRNNPDGGDWQTDPGCGWTTAELLHNYALGTFWFNNKAENFQIDLNISVNDTTTTLGDIDRKIQSSGGGAKLRIDEDNNSIVLIDADTEEALPVLPKYITLETTGCAKFDDTANKLGLTSYKGKNLNPVGLGQIKSIFSNTLEHMGWLATGPGGIDSYEDTVPWVNWADRTAGAFNPTNFTTCMIQGVGVSEGINYWGNVSGFDIPGISETGFSRGTNPAADLLFLLASYCAYKNGGSGNPAGNYDPTINTIWSEGINISGDIEIEGSFHSSPEGFYNTNTAGKKFAGTWNYKYPADTRVAYRGIETATNPQSYIALEWGIGRLTIDISDEGQGYTTGRTDTDGEETFNTPIIVRFKNLPKVSYSGGLATWDEDEPDRNQTLTFEHTGNASSTAPGKNTLFVPQTRLNEIGITTQNQINNISILQAQGERSWINDVTENVLYEVNLTNSNGTIKGQDTAPPITSPLAAIVGSGKYSVLQPTDNLCTLKQFIEVTTLVGNEGDGRIDLSTSISTLELDNNSNSIRIKNIRSDEGVELVSSILPYTTDSGFFYTTNAVSKYNGLLMPLDFAESLKIKYNRKKHQPVADNVILSGTTSLDIGQSIESFSLIPIPPSNDDDYLDLNGAEEALQSLYGTTTKGDPEGRGKVFFTRETYLTKTSGFYRTISFEDRGSPYYEQVRAEAPYGMFDPDVMPILFDYATGDNVWRFYPTTFKHRLAGTLVSNPGPQAFVGANNARVRKPIKDLTFWRDRMWMCIEDNVFSSKIGDYYDFWLDDPDNIVDSDPIDVRTGRGNLITINNLVPFEDYMFISTMNDMQFELLGSENQITPTTAELQATSFYSTDPILEPQLLGSQIYFFAPQKIYLYYGSTSASVNNATEVTFQAEKYLPTSFRDIASSAIKELISLVDKVNENHIYFYTSRFSGDKVIQNSLHRWIMSSTDKVRKIKFLDNDMYMISLRPFTKPSGSTSSQYFLSKLSLITEEEKYPRIDRRVSVVPATNPGSIEAVEVDTCGVISGCTMIKNSTKGYNVGDILTFTRNELTGNSNSGTGLKIKVTSVDPLTGSIGTFMILDGGSNYLLPSDVGETNGHKDNYLYADPSDAIGNSFSRGAANLAATVDVAHNAAVPVDNSILDWGPSIPPTVPSTTSGYVGFYLTAVTNKVPQGYGVGNIVEKATGSGTEGKFKVTGVKTVNYGGGSFEIVGMPTDLEVVERGTGWSAADTGVTTTVPGGYTYSILGIPFVVTSILDKDPYNIVYNTSYDAGQSQTTFNLPVHNDELNKAIRGKNQTDQGQEFTIVSSTTNPGKKTVVVVSGDQRVDNVISTEDLGLVENTATSNEEYFTVPDLFILSSDDYGRLFSFFSESDYKKENWFGTSFDMNATLSELVFRDQTNNALDGILNIKNLSIKYYKTGKFNLKVQRKPYNNNTDTVVTDQFYKERINSETFDSTKLNVQENGEFMAKIMSFAPNAVVSITSSYHEPVNIANMEFRGIFTPRMSSIRN